MQRQGSIFQNEFFGWGSIHIWSFFGSENSVIMIFFSHFCVPICVPIKFLPNWWDFDQTYILELSFIKEEDDCSKG